MLRSRGVLIAAVVLGGCTSDVERGRYQCDPTVEAGTAAAEAQCPGASRCGLEGFCHAAGDTSVAWRCRDRNDCENGFECGLSRDHSFRECHDPDAPDAGFACEADTDCVRSWHCGVNQRCYDRTQKLPFPCDGNDDCADGWRCGLDAVCHDTEVADAYACKVDGDCEQLWRCGLDGHCLDPSNDALRKVDTTLGAPVKVNPLLLDQAPELLAVSPVARPTFNDPRQHIAYYDQGEIRVLDLSVGGIPPIGSNPHRLQVLPDAGEVVALSSLGAASMGPLGKPDYGSWSYLSRPDGRLFELHFRTTVNPSLGFDGTPLREVRDTFNYVNVADEVTTSWIRVGSGDPDFVPTMLAYDRRPFTGPGAQYFYGWGGLSRQTFSTTFTGYVSDYSSFGPYVSRAGNRIVDAVTVTARNYTDLDTYEPTDCTVFADTRGLWVQQAEVQRTGIPKRYAMFPLVVPPFANGECAAETGIPQSHAITGLSSRGRDWVAVSAHPLSDAGVPLEDITEVALLDVRKWWDVVAPLERFQPFRGCYTNFNARCQPFSNPPNIVLPTTATTVLGPCRVCSGGSLVSMSAVPGPAGDMQLEARCRAGGEDGGTAFDSIVSLSRGAGQGTSCQRTAIALASSLGSDPVKVSQNNGAQLAFAGPRGHLWAGPSSATASPVFFDQAPTGVVTDPNAVPVFLGIDRIGWFAPELGILAFAFPAGDGDRPVSGVDGDRKALVTGARSIVTFDGVAPGESPRVIAGPDGTPTRFDPPYHAVRAVRTDGAHVVLVSAGDVLLAANLGLAKPLLQRRLVPAEGKAIVSLLALPKASSGPLLTTFALTQNALFVVKAESEQLWTATPAPLPPGEPIELWADGARGRVGFSDGKVYALETRVLIGAALDRRVDDYAQVCGQVYALAEGTLNRLTLAGGSAIGTWAPVPIGGALPSAELERGSLVPFTEADGGTSLYVFSRRGEAIRAPVAGCP